MEYVISIAKRYNHARTHYKDPRNRGIKGAKPVLGIYYYTEEGKLRFRKISRLLVPYYRSRIWKRKVCYCFECNSKFIGFVKNDYDNQECIYCSGMMCFTRKGLVKAIEKEEITSGLH